MKRSTCVIGLAVMLGMLDRAQALTLEERCQIARAQAAGKYAKCQASVVKLGSVAYDQDKAAKCRDKYRAVWPKLQMKFPSTSCAAARFANNGDGTVTDNLTGFMWEMKTDDDSVHDKDTGYNWSDTGSAANSSVFTAFLSALNSGACLADQCDWRLPSLAELQTLIVQSAPCSGSCTDPVLGFNQTGSSYWTASSLVDGPGFAWLVYFGNGDSAVFPKTLTYYARAVRGGL